MSKITKFKTLHIIRHAKSELEQECGDYDRGLNKRGFRDAALIGEYLATHNYTIEHVYCSSARRARLTCDALNRHIEVPAQKINYVDALYLASLNTLVSVIENIDNHDDQVAIIGHNPGLTELCNYLTGNYLQNLPTCAVYSVRFCVDDWQAIAQESGNMISLITPRQLK